MSVNNEADTEFLAGREYLDHRGRKHFTGGSVTWNFQWTSPASAACNTLNLYYIANFCNGDGGDFDDYPIAFTSSLYFAGADTVSPQIECPPSISVCLGDTIYYALPIVLDNCELDNEQPELVSGLPSGSVFPPGSTHQVFQVTDDFGLTATCSFTV